MARFVLRVNGTSREVDAEPGDSLLSILRDDLGLTGTHYGCGEGQCGACTVLLDGAGVRSCVTRVATVGAKAITTIEGLAAPVAAGSKGPAYTDSRRPGAVASAAATLHPVQQAFLDVEAFQCGYCTSGMIMAAVGMLRTNPNPSEQDIVRMMDRNVCRCGTNQRIVEAIKLAAGRMRTTPTAAGGAR
jgi:aerobic-type carbon monoxide dehydrogenase small subunit (CoxS/CutS family)